MSRNDHLLDAVSYSATAFLRAADWRDVVERVLERVGRAMGVTRVHLFRTLEINGSRVRSGLAYEWAVAPEWSEADSAELKDFTLEEFSIPAGPEAPPSERVLELDPAAMPAWARARWEARGIRAGLAIALFARGERWGALGLDHCFGERIWTSAEHSTLASIADALGAAIERELTERALRESEARLALALETSGQGSWDWDLGTGRVVFDALWCRMLGFEPGEPEPHVRQWERLVHPDDMALVRLRLDRHLAGELPIYEVEHRLLHKDGSWRWILDRGRVVERDAQDRPVRMVGTHTDITDRKNAEREKHQIEEQLRLLHRAVEQSPASIIITDPDGTIVYVNSRFTQITGYPRVEALGSNPRLLRSGVQSTEFYRELWSTIKAGREWRGELQNRRKDGQPVWLSAHISPVLDAAGAVTHFVAVQEDITDRLHLEEQLRRSQKLEAFGQIAGGVAHDFNNMLTVISGFAALLENEVSPDGEGAVYLAEMQHAAKRSADLTRQLLAFSRKQILSPVLLDLNSLVRRFEQMLKRVLGEDILLVTRLAPGALMVRADPGQLEQVMLNLAVNARDAMPDGGQLTLTTGEWQEPPHPTRYAQISVADTGCGIEPELVGRIFEPFFTTKPVGRGTGLGLSTVYGIITQSGGAITVESEPHRGSVFHVRLPLVSAEAPGEHRGGALYTAGRGSGTILVVEDENAVRSLAVAMLERAGYRALAAADGAEALQLLEKDAASVDLVLADVVMPGMGGRELSQVLRVRYPDLPVLFMSGHADDAVLRHGVEQQSMAFIAKPFTRDALLARISELLLRR